MSEQRLAGSLLIVVIALLWTSMGCVDDPGEITAVDAGPDDADHADDTDDTDDASLDCGDFATCIVDGQQICIDTDANADHCGGCADQEGDVCGDDEVCEDGDCVSGCPDDLTECNGTCTDLDRNPDHCGSCDNECSAGQACDDGECVSACSPGLQECDGSCVDLQTNPDYCGSCEISCGDYEYCDDGQCRSTACPGELTTCDDQCVDLDDHLDHCGTCNNECSTDIDDATAVCEAGQCSEECVDDLELCDGNCVDVDDRDDHCGACGVECSSGECVDGRCEPTDDCDPAAELTDNTVDGEDDTYLICTAYQLQQLDDEDLGDDPDNTFLLADDIDLGEEADDNQDQDDFVPAEDFEPIGNFTATLRGNGFAISNFDYQGSDNVGLFAQLDSDGDVRDLMLNDFVLEAESQIGALAGEHAGEITNVVVDEATIEADGQDVGGLVGLSDDGEITDSHTSGTIHNIEDEEVGRVGGLVGRHEGATISGSSSSVDVTGNLDDIGGLVGEFHGQEATLTDSHASGDVTSEGGNRVGGLVGTLDADVDDVYASGDVEADGDEVGGLVGRYDDNDDNDNDDCDISDSTASGDVTSTGGDDQESYGGLVGRIDNKCKIIDSTASGDVLAPQIDSVGGLVGRIDDDATVSNTSATGEVSGNTSTGGLIGRVDATGAETRESHASGDIAAIGDEVGGLVGRLDGTISRSYATGNVTATDDEVGGLVGLLNNSDAEVRESFATGSALGSEKVGGLAGHLDEGQIEDSYSVAATFGSETVGGLVGKNDEDDEHLEDTYAAGPVSGDSDVGGLIGEGNSEDSFWDIETTGQPESDGDETPLETEDFESISYFTGWSLTGDLNDDVIWHLVDDSDTLTGMGGDEDNIRPRLLWEFND